MRSKISGRSSEVLEGLREEERRLSVELSGVASAACLRMRAMMLFIR